MTCKCENCSCKHVNVISLHDYIIDNSCEMTGKGYEDLKFESAELVGLTKTSEESDFLGSEIFLSTKVIGITDRSILPEKIGYRERNAIKITYSARKARKRKREMIYYYALLAEPKEGEADEL